MKGRSKRIGTKPDRQPTPAPSGGLATAHNAPRILVVADDAGEREAIARALTPWIDTTDFADSAADGVAAIAARDPTLVLLYLGLPDGDGLEILRRLRRTSDATVVVYSGRASEEEKVALLDAGADDYVVKPVGDRELRARVQAHLRRADAAHPAGRGEVQCGDLRIDLPRKRATRRGAEIRLTPTEWALLRAFVAGAGRTLTHAALWEQVWGRQHGNAQLHLRVHITHLRRKLEINPAMPEIIVTEPGVGYRLELP